MARVSDDAREEARHERGKKRKNMPSACFPCNENVSNSRVLRSPCSAGTRRKRGRPFVTMGNDSWCASVEKVRVSHPFERGPLHCPRITRNFAVTVDHGQQSLPPLAACGFPLKGHFWISI